MKVRVLDKVLIDGYGEGTVLDVNEKDGNQLVSLGYVEKMEDVKESPKKSNREKAK